MSFRMRARLSLLILSLGVSSFAYATNPKCLVLMNDLTSESVAVHQSEDAGAYYCEHAFCINVQSAHYSPRMGVDASGEKLVGFLHVAPDVHLFGNTTYSQAKRHQKTRVIMAAALKGYFSALLENQPGSEEYRILLTGYEKFETIVNNPTQDFISNQENIDAAMEIAFGSKHQRISVADQRTQYVIMVDGEYKVLTIGTRSLSVDDRALNTTLPDAIRSFNPNAVISMGVGHSYTVEVRATDAGLTVRKDGVVHDERSPQTIEQRNYSLWNAIQRGSTPLAGER